MTTTSAERPDSESSNKVVAFIVFLMSGAGGERSGEYKKIQPQLIDPNLVI